MNHVESPESRRQVKNVVTGNLQQAELVYKVWPDLNDFNVRNYIEPYLPAAYEGLVLDTYELDPEPDAPDVWRVAAKYVLPQDSESGGGQTGAVAFQFSTVGGTQNVKQSLETITSKRCAPNPNGLAAFDHKKFINVGEDGPEGVDIYVPTLEFGWTYPVLSSAIDVFTLYELSGKVNATSYKGFPAGTLLFLGVDGSGEMGTIGATGKLTYKFQAKPNKTGIVINGADAVSKKGHEYLWTSVKKVEDAAAKTVRSVPLAVYVEKVYETADFALLGLP